MIRPALVLDADILVRDVLAQRVRDLISTRAQEVLLFAPDVAYAAARKYLPDLLERRGVPAAPAMEVPDRLAATVRPLDAEVYQSHQTAALQQIASRDADDWPILTCALALDGPMRTEDTDFFGAGVATWSTDRVAPYLA